METSVAIVAPGQMGSAIGRRLVERGFEVRTSLIGRSDAAAERARAAGMVDGDDEWVASVDLFLSVVPPAAAVSTAERFAGTFRAMPRPPVYLDLNAIGPETAARVWDTVSAAGARFVDGCIVGTVPRPGYAGPFLYASGPDRGELERLAPSGLDLNLLDAPNGAASALKLCFAGIMKGLTAVGSASHLAGARAGVGEALSREIARSQPELMAWFERQIPAMYPKTGRWVREMEEIADFLEEGEGAGLFDGAARLFGTLSGSGETTFRCLQILQSQFPPAGLDMEIEFDADA